MGVGDDFLPIFKKKLSGKPFSTAKEKKWAKTIKVLYLEQEKNLLKSRLAKGGFQLKSMK